MTNGEGGSAEYQTIVFQKQNRVRIPQQISAPISFLSHCSRALTSSPTRGGPRHSQNSWVIYKPTKHTHTNAASVGWGRHRPVSTWHKKAGDPPPPRHEESFSSHCSKTGIAMEHLHCKKNGEETRSSGQRDLEGSRMCFSPAKVNTWSIP